MKNDAQRVPRSSADAADAVAVIDTVDSARALHGSVMYSEDCCVTLPQRDHLGTRLHSRSLFGEHELASFEVFSGSGQQDRDLQGEYLRAVKVLMQAVVIAFRVLQEQRCRAALAHRVATLEEPGVIRGKAHRVAELFVPSVCNGYEVRVERRSQTRNHRRQRVGEVPVFSTPESEATHHDPTPEQAVLRI